MKKIILIFSLCFTTLLSAQEANNAEQPKKKDYVDFDFGFKVYLFSPMQLGDHALAEAHNSTIGFGASMMFLSYGDFHLNAGFDKANYSVSDHTLMGNFNTSNYSSIYGTVSYEYPIAKKIHLFPNAGFGYAIINQRSKSISFGHQDGTELRLGLTGNYYFAEEWSVFFGAHFIHNSFEINTNSEYEKFFGQANQIQLSLGIQLN